MDRYVIITREKEKDIVSSVMPGDLWKDINSGPWVKYEDVEELEEENKRLKNIVKDLADELENNIHYIYPNEMHKHPSMKRRYDRDMGIIITARKALGGGNE